VKDEKVFKDKLDTELDNYMKQGTTAFGICFKKHSTQVGPQGTFL